LKHLFAVGSVFLISGIYFISLWIAPYFYWDDEWMVVTNPYLTKYDLGTLYEVVFKPFSGQYSPVNTLLYMGIVGVFGFNSLVFHLVCLALHIVNTFLVFRFVGALVSQKGHAGFTEMHVFWVSASVALLFGISPLQIESVSWISASKILLSSLFFLLSCIKFLTFTSTKNKTALLLSFLFFVLALGSKEQSVVLPVILLCILWHLGKSRKYYLWLIPFFALSVLSGVLSLAVQDDGFSTLLTNSYYPLYQRIVLSCYAVTQYIVKILLPVRQWMFYKFPMEPGEALPFFYYIYPLVDVVLLYFVYRLFRSGKYDYILFGLAFFIVNIFLTVHVVPLGRESLMADRYTYLSLIGVFFALSMYVANLIGKTGSAKHHFPILAACVVYIILTYTKAVLYIIEWSHFWLNDIGD